jgi:hypothetical protein
MTSMEKTSTEKTSTEKTSTEKTTTDKKANVTPKTKLWSDQEEQNSKVGENNRKYAEWWIANLNKKAQTVVSITKMNGENTHGKITWAKNAVRVKLYNKLNGYMEEHSLFDLLSYMNNNTENPFLEKTPDKKWQVNVVGTYYISSDLYVYIKKLWDECVKNDVSD